jgi:hypothetical protein
VLVHEVAQLQVEVDEALQVEVRDRIHLAFLLEVDELDDPLDLVSVAELRFGYLEVVQELVRLSKVHEVLLLVDCIKRGLLRLGLLQRALRVFLEHGFEQLQALLHPQLVEVLLRLSILIYVVQSERGTVLRFHYR